MEGQVTKEERERHGQVVSEMVETLSLRERIAKKKEAQGLKPLSPIRNVDVIAFVVCTLAMIVFVLSLTSGSYKAAIASSLVSCLSGLASLFSNKGDMIKLLTLVLLETAKVLYDYIKKEKRRVEEIEKFEQENMLSLDKRIEK